MKDITAEEVAVEESEPVPFVHDIFGEFPALAGTGVVEQMRGEFLNRLNLAVPEAIEPVLAAGPKNWFFVQYEKSKCHQPMHDLETEIKAFELKDDAEKFFMWHKLLGNGVALYNGAFDRLRFDAECGYEPAFFEDQIEEVPLPELANTLTEIDPEAPYFFGFSFNGKPGGRVIMDREEAFELIGDPYW
jgi:hypothetical protein